MSHCCQLGLDKYTDVGSDLLAVGARALGIVVCRFALELLYVSMCVEISNEMS